MENQQREVNVQDSFLYSLRRDGRLVFVYLLNGKRLVGVLKRFDRYSLVLESHGQEQLVFKHAVASIGPAQSEAPGGARAGA